MTFTEASLSNKEVSVPAGPRPTTATSYSVFINRKNKGNQFKKQKITLSL
jgi:hypothetical protein